MADGFHYFDAEPGDYWKQLLGTEEDPGEQFIWTIRDPKGNLGSLGKHTVTEHDDGTITVSPSILDERPGDPNAGWHGFLEHGVWRS